ncbi:MAG: hypothetical protein AAF735_06775 [Myxococcota bacterium]
MPSQAHQKGPRLRNGQSLAQAADEAYDYLVGVHRQMEFFRANGYRVALPDQAAFAADTKKLGNRQQFTREVYRPEVFEKAGIPAA